MKTHFWNRAALAVLGLSLCLMGSAEAASVIGQPAAWEINLQKPVTDVAQFIYDFHTAVVVVITIISLFVLGLIVWVVMRYNEKANPVPSRTTHHTGLEIAWTVIPILILVGIAIPSFRLLKLQVQIPPHDIVVKVIGKQWYWTYEYPADQGGGFGFDSIMLSDADAAKAGQPRMLAVDNEMVVPAGKVIAMQVVGADVIHSFSVPSLGFRMDAIPGRLNETWFKTDREGIYYGMCSRLCGQNHAYMPIAIRVVSPEKYTAWLAEAKKKFASNDNTMKVAANAAAQ